MNARPPLPPLRLGAAPQELQRVGAALGARLALRQRVEGPLSGTHASPRQGASLHFAQHRDYVPGDDPRHLDWRAYAKNDRYVVRQYQQETNLRAFMVLDRSCSMGYLGGGRVSKGAFAAEVALALSWALLLQGEAVGLATFGGGLARLLPAASGREQFWRLLAAVEESAWEPDTDAAAALGALAERLPPRSAVCVLTDALELDARGEGLTALARRMRAQGHSLSLLHVLDPHEARFPFEDLSRFEGFEGEEPLTLDPATARAAYLEELAALCDGLARRAREGGVRYLRLLSDEPTEAALARLAAGGVTS
ncbi:MAG: DUF58 domain-containing protein [Deltaproteobacteria bacterium]|nr:DUF58 domain-containing protein [Deltaproteobacteria bacterium]